MGRGRGRGRGKGRKQTVASHEDLGSGGEEVLPTYKRRGRPQNPLKNNIAEEMEQIEDGDDDVKPSIPNKEVKSLSPGDGTKRKKQQQVNLEDSDSNLEDNSISVGSGIEDSSRSNGFRQNRSRRKNKPRRAAEAGVECRL